MKRLMKWLGCACLARMASGACGQQYPGRPIRIVAPFAPGGGTDFIARLIAQKPTERLGLHFHNPEGDAATFSGAVDHGKVRAFHFNCAVIQAAWRFGVAPDRHHLASHPE